MTDNTSPPLTTSAIMTKLREIRDERRRISEREKELIADWKNWEAQLITLLDEQGMLKASSVAGTASITEVIVPQVVDWDAVYEHIRETGDFYLLQKRPAAAAFRELHDSDITVPGMEPYTKRNISLRNS